MEHSTESDDALVRRIRAGDADAAEELVNRYYAPILRFCGWQIRGARNTEPEDLAQETFCRAFRALDGYRERGLFRAWLYRIARSTVQDEARRHFASQRLERELEAELTGRMHAEGNAGEARKRADGADIPGWEAGARDAGIARIEARDELERLLAPLSPEQREAVVLHFGEELTFREIGELLGVPARTVQSRVNKGLRRIRRTQ